MPKLKSVRFLNRQEQGYFFLSRCQALERDQRPWQPAFEWRSRKAGVVNDHVTCGNICPWVWKSASRTVTSRAVSRTMSGNNDRPATRGTEFNPMCFTSFENGKCLALRSNFEKFPSHEKLKKKTFLTKTANVFSELFRSGWKHRVIWTLFFHKFVLYFWNDRPSVLVLATCLLRHCQHFKREILLFIPHASS